MNSLTINFRAHGANPEKFYAAMGVAIPKDRKIIDFSTNASVLPWPTLPKLKLRELVSHYPDDECTELRELIAKRESLSPENVLIVNGSNEIFYILAALHAVNGSIAAIVQPAYSEYKRALDAYRVPVREVTKFFGSIEGILDGDIALVMLSNPNNPTGEYRRDWFELARKFPRTCFAIDEAYIDFLLTQERVKVNVRELPNLMLLRSLTKLYHLSGIRIGYVLAHEERITFLKSCQPTWSVNAVAQELALAFLRNEKFLADSRAFYANETPRLIKSIEVAGFHVRPSDVHYFLVDMPDQNPEHEQDLVVIRELMQRGMVVRHTRNFHGLDGRCVRIATRTPDENDKLCEALSEIRATLKGRKGR